jgi:hypothetical protein
MMAKTDPRPLADVLAEGQVRRLADALAYAFNVAEGSTLVWVIGTGSERDNREALAHWVRQQVAELDATLAGVLLPELIARLERQLRRWEASL